MFRRKKVIPKSFKIRTEIPGNKATKKQKLDKVSLEAVYDEKERQSNVLKSVNSDFIKLKRKLKQLFNSEAEQEELNLLGKHLNQIEAEEVKRKNTKNIRDVTLAHDDGNVAATHKEQLAFSQSVFLQYLCSQRID